MHKLQAVIFQFGLETGLSKKEEIISWADSILESDEPYSDWVGELATCKEKNESAVFSILGTVPGTVSHEELWNGLRYFVKNKLKEGIADPRAMVSTLLTRYQNGYLPKEAEEKLIEFELDYGVAIEGYVTKEEIDHDVEEYFYA